MGREVRMAGCRRRCQTMQLFGAIAIAVIVVTFPSAAGAAFPGENGRIAFHGFDPGVTDSDEIFTIRRNQTGLDQLTDDLVDDTASAFSANGNKIAFQHDGDIWVIGAEGDNPHPVIDGPAFEHDPAWSPNGKMIVYSATDGLIDHIYTARADGTGTPTPLTDGNKNDDDPAWSDNNLIAFERDFDGDDEIFTMRPNAERKHRVTKDSADDDDPDFSPKGGRMAFASDRGTGPGQQDRIWTMNLQGEHRDRVTASKNNDSDFAAYSPDGRFIAFDRAAAGNRQVFYTRANGSGQPIQVTDFGGFAEEPSWQPR